MDDNIIPFEPKKRASIPDDDIVDTLYEIIDRTKVKGGILLLMNEDQSVSISVSEGLTTRDMAHMRCTVIHDAYDIEEYEHSPFRA